MDTHNWSQRPFPSEDLLLVEIGIEEFLLQSELPEQDLADFVDRWFGGNHTTWRNTAVNQNEIIKVLLKLNMSFTSFPIQHYSFHSGKLILYIAIQIASRSIFFSSIFMLTVSQSIDQLFYRSADQNKTIHIP